MIRPPDYAALINPIACSAYSLRYEHRADLIKNIQVNTRVKSGGKPTQVTLVDYVVKLPVCDALMHIAPFVTVVTPVDPEYAARFMMAQLYETVDGDPKVVGESVRQYLLAPPYQLKYNSDQRRPLVVLGEKEGDLLGVCRLQFIPNDSRIIIKLKGIPSGAGVIQINAGVLMGYYTTKVKQGPGYEVGVLDDQQQAVRVSHTWEPSGDVLTPEKLEKTHGNRVQELVQKEFDKKQSEDRELLGRIDDERKRRVDVEQKLLEEQRRRREEEDFQLRAKKEDMPRAVVGVEPPSLNLEATLQRAKQRLIRWGIIALWASICAAAVLYVVFDQIRPV